METTEDKMASRKKLKTNSGSQNSLCNLILQFILI